MVSEERMFDLMFGTRIMFLMDKGLFVFLELVNTRGDKKSIHDELV